MAEFKIGEMAKFQGPEREISFSLHKYNGEDVEITGPLGLHDVFRVHHRYPCRFSDGWEAYIHPKHLHKRQPPKEDNTETRQADKPLMGCWEDIHEITGWSPIKVPVHDRD